MSALNRRLDRVEEQLTLRKEPHKPLTPEIQAKLDAVYGPSRAVNCSGDSGAQEESNHDD